VFRFQTNQEEGKEAFESPVIIHRARLTCLPTTRGLGFVSARQR
jgi:hypothetical protein